MQKRKKTLASKDEQMASLKGDLEATQKQLKDQKDGGKAEIPKIKEEYAAATDEEKT